MSYPIFSIRMHPKTRELLDRAKEAGEGRTIASIIDRLVREAYEHRYTEVGTRLDSMLRSPRV
jgi:phosphopantetheine adenylyltransferase